MTPDHDLLRQYAEHGDESAFAEVVRRQADLVYGTALRVTNDTSLAHDVTQSVFTILARRAGPLCRHVTLVGWLHTTTRNCALTALRSENRRRAREQEAFLMQNISSAPDANWEQLRPHLDEAMGNLRERDRQAILLRYFNGHSNREVGAVLGLSENTAQKCIERALEKLRGYFARRGITISSAMLATTMSNYSTPATPAGLAANVAAASLAGASGGAALSGAWWLTLFMSLKTKIILALVVILILAGVLAIKLQGPHESPRAVNAPATSVAHATPPPAPPRPAAMQVASPAIAPVIPAKQTAPVASTGSPATAAPNTTDPAPTFVAQPQSDLKAAIATGDYFIQAGDFLSLLKTLMPPDVMAQEMKDAGATSLEDYAAIVSQNPNMVQKMNDLKDVLPAIENQEPAHLSADGLQAAYTFDPPINGHKDIEFTKIDGFWYLK